MTNHVTLNDFQPGAEFYSVFCIGNCRRVARAMDAHIEKGTIVCNSGVIYGTKASPDYVHIDASYSRENRDTPYYGARRTVSLRDLHVPEVVGEGITYNFHRFFKTLEDCESWIKEIETGTFVLERDQKFFNEQEMFW